MSKTFNIYLLISSLLFSPIHTIGYSEGYDSAYRQEMGLPPREEPPRVGWFGDMGTKIIRNGKLLSNYFKYKTGMLDKTSYLKNRYEIGEQYQDSEGADYLKNQGYKDDFIKHAQYNLNGEERASLAQEMDGKYPHVNKLDSFGERLKIPEDEVDSLDQYLTKEKTLSNTQNVLSEEITGSDSELKQLAEDDA